MTWKLNLLYWKIIKLWHALASRFSVSYKLTEKNDICRFGIILLEIITSWPVIARSHNENTHINQWMRIMLALGDIQSIVDQNFHWDFNVIAAWKAIEIAMFCVSPTFTRRLTMSLVMAKLKEWLRLSYLKGRAVRVNQSIHVKWSTWIWFYEVKVLDRDHFDEMKVFPFGL